MVEQRPEEPLVGVSKAPGGTTWRHGRNGEDTGLSIRRLRVRFPLASPFFITYKKSSFGIQMSFSLWHHKLLCELQANIVFIVRSHFIKIDCILFLWYNSRKRNTVLCISVKYFVFEQGMDCAGLLSLPAGGA